jgi:hypothetical protein
MTDRRHPASPAVPSRKWNLLALAFLLTLFAYAYFINA